MPPFLKRWLPELLLLALLLFVSIRELGTYPAAWSDEGLFIIVAKMIAAGKGYVLPLLDRTWSYPYFLNVGPALILPVALSLKLFGLSIEAARAPMVVYLVLASGAFYAFTRKTQGMTAARWATLLLVTLSAYINTGKPVLGEVPAFFFVMLGLLAWVTLGKHRGWLAGAAFGLAMMTKVTFGLILPALAVAWIAALLMKNRDDLKQLTIAGMTSAVVFGAWRMVEVMHTLAGGLEDEIRSQLIGSGEQTTFLTALRTEPRIFLNLPFLAFGLLLVFAVIGWRASRARVNASSRITLLTLIILFILYCTLTFGWYRLILPAHLLLLIFVPTGAMRLLGKRGGAVLMACIALAQGYWLLDHRGSGQSDTALAMTALVQTEYADKDIVIQQTEIFARLPENPRWHFLMPNLSFSLPKEYNELSGDWCRMPFLQKLNPQEKLTVSGSIVHEIGGYQIVAPPYPCPPFPHD